MLPFIFLAALICRFSLSAVQLLREQQQPEPLALYCNQKSSALVQKSHRDSQRSATLLRRCPFAAVVTAVEEFGANPAAQEQAGCGDASADQPLEAPSLSLCTPSHLPQSLGRVAPAGRSVGHLHSSIHALGPSSCAPGKSRCPTFEVLQSRIPLT